MFFFLASQHLKDVKLGIVEKIKLLNEELTLVDKHLEDQQRKQDEVSL